MKPIRPSRAQALGRLAVYLWVPGSIVVVALLMTSHLLALPTPAARAVEVALARLDARETGWRAFHVLYTGCPCSLRVAESLVLRGARIDFRERVLLVGEDEVLSGRLRARGFAVDSLTQDELKARYGVEAAPAFFAVGPDGTVRYLGGYTAFSQGQEQDSRLLDLVRRGDHPDPLPLYGCAVSRELQARTDPFGIKYPTTEKIR